jgi:hypothetical protein
VGRVAELGSLGRHEHAFRTLDAWNSLALAYRRDHRCTSVDVLGSRTKSSVPGRRVAWHRHLPVRRGSWVCELVFAVRTVSHLWTYLGLRCTRSSFSAVGIRATCDTHSGSMQCSISSPQMMMTRYRPPEKLDVQMTANVRFHFFQFLRSLRRFGSGWGANHALQRTRPSRPGCNRTPSWAGSLSLGR